MNDQNQIVTTPTPPSLSPQVQLFAEREQYIEQALSGISQALPQEAESEQNQLVYIGEHLREMTTVIKQQDLFLQGSAAVVNQLKVDIQRLEEERDDALSDAESGYEYGFDAGYQQGMEDMGTDGGWDDDEWDGEITPDRRVVENSELQHKLAATEQRNRDLESALQDVAMTAEEHSNRLAEIETELASKNALLVEAEQKQAELEEARATIARFEAWYAANFPDQVA